ncbi:hypothetical protein MRX96_024116 [Rhipicephalus microplus]
MRLLKYRVRGRIADHGRQRAISKAMVWQRKLGLKNERSKRGASAPRYPLNQESCLSRPCICMNNDHDNWATTNDGAT